MSIEKNFVASKSRFKVTFRITQELIDNGKQIQVLGDFNQWDSNTAPSLKKSKGGYTSTIELEPGKYAFRYLIDGHKWINDNNADAYEFSAFANDSNSIIILPHEENTKTTNKPKTPVKQEVHKANAAVTSAIKNAKAKKNK